MIRTIFFDFGNVLGRFDHGRAVKRLLDYTDLPPERLSQLIYHGDLEFDYECGRISTDRLFGVVRELAALHCDLGQFTDAFCDIFWRVPEMESLIPRLKTAGLRLVLASNTNDAHYNRYRMMFADVLEHFDARAVSHQVGFRKPDPRFFEYAHRLSDADRAECLFVDDMPENVEAARAFGWQAVHFTDVESLRAELTRLGIAS